MDNGSSTALGGDLLDGSIGRRFVVGRITERIETAERVLNKREHVVEQQFRIRWQIVLAEDGRLDRGIGETLRQLLPAALGLQSTEGRTMRERVMAGEAEQHAERPRGDLRVQLAA